MRGGTNCRRAAISLLAVAFLAACGADGGSTQAVNDRPGGSSGSVPEVVSNDWPTAGADLANTRAAVASPITSRSVADLQQLWRTDLPGIGSLSMPRTVQGSRPTW